MTVRVEVLNLATFEWIAHEFLGSKPGYTLVGNPGGQTWIANNCVRFPHREN